MAAPQWVLAVVFAAVAGPHAALDTSWLWWVGAPPVEAVRGDSSEAPSDSPPNESEGKADAPDGNMREGYARAWGHSVLHFDLKSWFGHAWFSTPLPPGQLSAIAGWGLHRRERIGVLTCGDFWPWIGWGIVITLFTLLACLGLHAVISICRPIRTFCSCCCRQTRAVARKVGELLPELQAGGKYEGLAPRGPKASERVAS